MNTITAALATTVVGTRLTPRSVLAGRLAHAFLAPRSNVLGALPVTAHLGGAVATDVRTEADFLGRVMFPVHTAILVLGGLWLRDPEVRAIPPFRH